MFSRRRSLASSVEVGFIGNSVLKVAEIVSFISKQFHECDSQVRGIALQPARIELRNEIKQQATEARVVLCQVINDRFDGGLRWTNLQVAAVKIGRAAGLEI